MNVTKHTTTGSKIIIILSTFLNSILNPEHALPLFRYKNTNTSSELRELASLAA
jgi:hypothetical protein